MTLLPLPCRLITIQSQSTRSCFTLWSPLCPWAVLWWWGVWFIMNTNHTADWSFWRFCSHVGVPRTTIDGMDFERELIKTELNCYVGVNIEWFQWVTYPHPRHSTPSNVSSLACLSQEPRSPHWLTEASVTPKHLPHKECIAVFYITWTCLRLHNIWAGFSPTWDL